MKQVVKKIAYDFRKFKTVRFFGKEIYNGKITLEDLHEKKKKKLKNEINKLKESMKSKTLDEK